MICRPLLLSLVLALASCSDIPADPDGTLERVQRERTFRVGLVASGTDPLAADRQRLFLQRIALASGAVPVAEAGAMEPLLLKLEEGGLDLVIGHLAPDSPWAKRVTLLPPLHEEVSEAGHDHLIAAAKNGENAWIGLLHPAARAVRAAR